MPDEDDALVALREAITTLDPPPSSIDVSAITGRSAARAQRRRSVVRRTVSWVAVAAASAGLVAGVVHLRGTTPSAQGSSTSAGSASSVAAAPVTTPGEASSLSSPTSKVCPLGGFEISIPAEGAGAATARAALDAWLQSSSNAYGPAPQNGWEQQPTAGAPCGVDFSSDGWQLHTAQLPGRGWFVTGGSTC